MKYHSLTVKYSGYNKLIADPPTHNIISTHDKLSKFTFSHIMNNKAEYEICNM